MRQRTPNLGASRASAASRGRGAIWAGLWTTVLGVTALAVATPRLAEAQASEPVAVVTVQSLNSLLGSPTDDEDVGAVGRLMTLAGFDGYAALGKGVSAAYMRGIKRDQPWAVLVRMEGEEFQTTVALPTDDIKLLLRTLRGQIGEFDVRDDGLIEIELPFIFAPAYIKQTPGWAYFSTDLDTLATVPADPKALMAGLEQKYVIGAEVYPGNIPEETRESWITLMRAGMQAAVENADPEEAAGRLQAAEMQVRSIEQLLTETEKFSLGLTVDSMAEETVLEIIGVGEPGSDMAKQAAALQTATTRFAHLVRKDATATMQFVQPMTPQAIAQWNQMKQSVEESAMSQIENDGDLSANEKAQAKKVVGDFISILGETIESGRLDAAGFMTTSGETLQGVFAGHVADGKKLEATTKEFLKLGTEKEKDVTVRFDIETVSGVTLHHVAVPIKDDPEEKRMVEASRKIFGKNVDIYVGFDAKTIYAAFGKGSLDTLKTVIGQAPAAETRVTTPQSIRVSVKAVAEFLVPLLADKAETREGLIKSAKAMGPKSEAVIEVTPIEGGTSTRIAIGDDVIRFAGEAARQGQPGGDEFDF